MANLKAWACATAFACMFAAPVVMVAQPAHAQKKIEKLEKVKPNKHTRAGPGPVAGIGLPVAAFAGGYIWIRNRYRNRKRKAEPNE